MQIDKKLNLVLTVDRADRASIFVHSTPIRQEIFTRYYAIIAKTFTRIYGDGLGFLAGPRVAAMILRDVAKAQEQLDGPGGAENGLLNEIKRLTAVIAPGISGWETLPFVEAVARKILSDDEVSEVENAIVFFIVASAMHRKSELTGVLDGAKAIWGGQIVSSTSTEYAASLPISTTAEASGAREIASSIPS